VWLDNAGPLIGLAGGLFGLLLGVTGAAVGLSASAGRLRLQRLRQERVSERAPA
jgi:hypothetical protein